MKPSTQPASDPQPKIAIANHSPSPTDSDERRLKILKQLMAGTALLLFLATWKLWTPQTEFPQIPFFEFLIHAPGWIDWIAIAFGVTGLVGCLIAGQADRKPLWLFAASATILILLNQHRLQPWAYQFVVFAIIIASTPPKTALFWIRWIVISIYFYSAISKFDYQFVMTVGDGILTSLTNTLGLDARTWPPEIRNLVTIGLPLIELLVAVGLIFPRLRKTAVVTACLMHVSIFLTLLFAGHSLGVLIWNLYFIVQTPLLFWNRKSLFKNTQSPSRSFPLRWLGPTLAIGVLAFPLTQPLGICDHWPAWQVYAPRTSRARVEYHKSSANSPAELSSPVVWSNETLGVPVYPQARFQFAVSMASIAKHKDFRIFNIEVSSESNRLTGERSIQSLRGDQIKMHAEKYWLNLKPRSILSQPDPLQNPF